MNWRRGWPTGSVGFVEAVVRRLQIPVVQDQLRDDQARGTAACSRMDSRTTTTRRPAATARGRCGSARVLFTPASAPVSVNCVHEVGGGLGIAHRPEDARRGHLRLRFDAELHAPEPSRRVLHVVARIGAGRLERDELVRAVRPCGASAAPPGPWRRSRSSRSTGSCHSSAISAELSEMLAAPAANCAGDQRNDDHDRAERSEEPHHSLHGC